jgi:hypothetical protein
LGQKKTSNLSTGGLRNCYRHHNHKPFIPAPDSADHACTAGLLTRGSSYFTTFPIDVDRTKAPTQPQATELLTPISGISDFIPAYSAGQTHRLCTDFPFKQGTAQASVRKFFGSDYIFNNLLHAGVHAGESWSGARTISGTSEWLVIPGSGVLPTQ